MTTVARLECYYLSTVTMEDWKGVKPGDKVSLALARRQS